jgi:heat shock protein 1/8
MTNKIDYAIGIDLGTTYSCVGVWKNNRVEILANEFSNRITPSYVAFTDTERLIGNIAKDQILSNKKNTIMNVKRFIGYNYEEFKKKFKKSEFPYNIVNKNNFIGVKIKYKNKFYTFQPEEISAIILEKMKEIAEKYLGQKVTKAVITVPAYFNESQRQATKDAGKIAGLEVLRIINEPTAAALAYGFNECSITTGKNILVYDFGGGTLDCSLLTIKNKVFNVRATSGNTYLGGEDIDNALVKYCINDFKKKTKVDISNNKKAIQKLKIKCEQAKKVLSTVKSTEILVDSLHNTLHYKLYLTRSKFENICKKIFQKAFNPIKIVLDEACLQKSDIDNIVLVGGSSRIPKIQKMISKFFNKELSFTINMDEAVAHGAAIQAALLNNNQTTKMNNILLLDVLPLSLGIETAGGILTKIVNRNIKLPCCEKQILSTATDNQIGLTIKIFQGERILTKDNHKLGEFNFLGIPPMKRAQPRIEITFEVDIDGLLHVKALETSTKKSKKITIVNNKSKLSNKQINEMIEQAKKFKTFDNELLELIESRNRLENLAYHIKTQLDENLSDKNIKVDDIKNLKSSSSDILNWLDTHKTDNIKIYTDKYNNLETKFKKVLSEQVFQQAI